MTPLLLAAWLSRAGLIVALPPPATPGPERPVKSAAQAAPPTHSPDDVPEVPPPFQPQVSDPLLTPVPPPPLQVKTWGEALDLLRQRSTDLRTALAQVEVAAGQWRIALANLLPTINGTIATQLPKDSSLIGGGLSGGISGGGSGVEGSNTGAKRPTQPLVVGLLTGSMPLVDLGSIYGVGTAKESRHTAALSLAETKRQLTLGLAQALVTASSAERLAEVNRVNLRTALERQALAQRRFDLGAGTRLDVVRVAQDTEIARTAVVTGDEDLRKARESLGLVLGIPAQVGPANGAGLEQLLDHNHHDCRALSDVNERSDLEVARSRLKVAERAVTGVKWKYAPTLDLSATAVAITVDPGFADVPAWGVGVSLNLPFWDGGAREGSLRQTRAEADQARQNVVARERSVSVEVVRARRQVEVARSTRDIAARERALAEESDRLTRRSFEVGTGTSLELVQSAGDLRRAELELVVREFQYQQAQVDAFLAEAACDW
ncbi:TolC family protein [Corallococcus sp. H22C18031201]|uniref:TolC family protein n=1 Tax=Citreicoccus inhibens TaxID=2849499 RepID=UPI000E71F87B|nr:TolC family protein [Citreicoccus inhibens]MBU8896661.1 TolC family protein [Citreicoccus inhibens]RJS14744.1 TolC family protein [Corallococcus sp. H22C18031201]